MLINEKIAIISTSCFRSVGELMSCTDCSNKLIKYGKTKNGKQRYYCCHCLKSQVLKPCKPGYGNKFNKQIVQFTREGLGIRSTARILGIAPSTIIRKILAIADGIVPSCILNGLRIQVDEMHTFIQNKKREIYIIYSWSRELKRALSLAVGTRSKANLRSVINPLLNSNIESINTDRYSGYRGVVPKKFHTTFKRRNNGIERQNLNLRTHLKRLSRRTICFSKSKEMLEAVLKIYFWG